MFYLFLVVCPLDHWTCFIRNIKYFVIPRANNEVTYCVCKVTEIFFFFFFDEALPMSGMSEAEIRSHKVV